MTREQSKRCDSVGYDDEVRGPRAKECGQPLGAGKVKEMDSLLPPSERDAVLMIR